MGHKMIDSEASAKGRESKELGRYFEQIISKSCEWYSQRGTAEIEKTPEPMRPLRSLGKGKFLAVFEKAAQPDYKGTLQGGKAIVIEAKCTSTQKISQSVVTDEQTKRLTIHRNLGAEAFVLVSFSLRTFYMIPWNYFLNMKTCFGRKYVTENDLKVWRVPFTGGILHFLDRVNISILPSENGGEKR